MLITSIVNRDHPRLLVKKNSTKPVRFVDHWLLVQYTDAQLCCEACAARLRSHAFSVGQRWARMRTGSDSIRIEANFGRIRTGSDCFFFKLADRTGSDWYFFSCFNDIILTISKTFVVIRFYKFVKWYSIFCHQSQNLCLNYFAISTVSTFANL